MPIYEYRCTSCEHKFEEVQKFSDPPLEVCPDCGENTAKRQVSVSAFHLKGGGWYKDGYSEKRPESETSAKTEKEGSPATNKETSRETDKKTSTSDKSGSSSSVKSSGASVESKAA